MREAVIKYRRFLFPHTHKVDIPESWQDVSVRQFLAIARLYLSAIDEQEFLMEFYGLSNYVMLGLDSYSVYKLAELASFIRDHRQIHNGFYFKSIPGTDLKSPNERLNGMCLQQFMTIDTYYNRYALSKDESLLDKMVAVTYMPEGTVFCPPLSSAEGHPPVLNMDKNLAVVRRIPKDVKMAVLLNFMLIKNWLGRLFPYLFPASDDSPKSSSAPKPVDWLEIFDAFVGDNVAEMEKYQRMEVLSAFRVMNRRIKIGLKNGPAKLH